MGNKEQKIASNAYSLMTRIHHFDNMFLKTQSSASQFIEQVNFYQARKSKILEKTDDDTDVLGTAGGLGDWMAMAVGDSHDTRHIYTSADAVNDEEMAEDFTDWNNREWGLMVRNQKDLLEGF